MPETYSNHPLYIERIQCTVNSALSHHSQLACFFVTLRFPQNKACRDDHDAISRFIDALKYQINTYIDVKRSQDKRVHSTTLHYIWAREFGIRNENKHYHVVLILNKNTFHQLGHYSLPDSGPGSLANMIQRAWCSAIKLPVGSYANLASFTPEFPCMWIENNAPFQRTQAEKRMFYLAKYYSKRGGDNKHSFECSQSSPSLLNGRKRN